MISNKVLMGIALLTVAGAANAGLTLTNVSGSLAGQFSGLTFAPTYNDALGTANLTISTPHSVSMGIINSWLFTAVDTTDIGTLSYDITLNHILPKGMIMDATLTAYQYTPNQDPTKLGTVGAPYGGGLVVFEKDIDTYTGLNSSTQTIDFGYNLSSFRTMDAEYKLNVTFATPEPAPYAVMGLGVVGLVIRRRRAKK